MSTGTSVTLAELIAPTLGSVDPSKHTDEYFDLYSIPAFDSGEPEMVLGAEIGSVKQLIEPGDVLLSRIVPHIRRAWVVGSDRGRRLVGSSEWIVFRSNRFESRFLRHMLVSDAFHAEFMRTVSGVGGSLLRARPTHVVKIRVTLPPLTEQRRIADILDEANALRAKRQAALAQLDILTQSIFLDMFGDPTSNPKGWKVRSLSESGVRFRYGTSNKSAADGKWTLRIPNVIGGSIDLDDLKRVPVTGDEFDRLRLQAGDLLFVRTNGNPDYVGRCAVYDPEPITDAGFDEGDFIFASYLIRGRIPDDSLSPAFLREHLTTHEGRRSLRARSKTSAGQYNLNTEGLGAIRVMVPPAQLQREFARQTNNVAVMRRIVKAAANELDSLFASLQHRAFRGEL